jgi:hypothetical protein
MPRCYADPNPVYAPAMRIITAITNSFPAVVTTSFAHGYLTGLIVRLNVKQACGMQQIAGQKGTITVDPSTPTMFSINIDSTNYDPYVQPPDSITYADICSQVVPIGESNDQLIQAVRNILPPLSGIVDDPF